MVDPDLPEDIPMDVSSERITLKLEDISFETGQLENGKEIMIENEQGLMIEGNNPLIEIPPSEDIEMENPGFEIPKNNLDGLHDKMQKYKSYIVKHNKEVIVKK